MDWSEFDSLLKAALAEDAAEEDATTGCLIDAGQRAVGRIVMREEGVACGLPVAARLAELFDPELEFDARLEDGQSVVAGTLAGELRGPAAAVLAVERTMLNFLQRLSGVATLTARYVALVEGTGAAIYDTRKTTPGWRRLEKYAVRCGGGRNHRMDLSRMVLVKDNHLKLLARGRSRAEAVQRAVRAAREAHPDLQVEIEVEDTAQLNAALAVRPDIIMLDNMSPEDAAEAVSVVRQTARGEPGPQIEASGGIGLSSVADYAAAGVDRIALGALTHSAPALDISLSIAG